MSDLTQRLDEIQARADAATEGPWDLASLHVVASGRYDHDDDSYWVADTFGHETTGHFIASARTDVPALVAALRAVLSEDAARRIVAMNHQVTPEELTSDDLWLVQEVEAILAAVAAASLGVTS